MPMIQARGEAMQMASEQAESGMISVVGLQEQELAELCVQVSQKPTYHAHPRKLLPGGTGYWR